jgi:hypothetical protein
MRQRLLTGNKTDESMRTAVCVAPSKVLRASRKERQYRSSEISICKPRSLKAAKVAPRWHPDFALLYDREKQKGNRNRATLAIARKLVSYLLSVDRADRVFLPQRPVPTKLQPRSA